MIELMDELKKITSKIEKQITHFITKINSPETTEEQLIETLKKKINKIERRLTNFINDKMNPIEMTEEQLIDALKEIRKRKKEELALLRIQKRKEYKHAYYEKTKVETDIKPKNKIVISEDEKLEKRKEYQRKKAEEYRRANGAKPKRKFNTEDERRLAFNEAKKQSKLRILEKKT